MKWRGLMTGLLLGVGLTVTALGGIQEGMTREALLELRGRPRASIAQDNKEYMEFDNGVEVELTDGRVTQVGDAVGAGASAASSPLLNRAAWKEPDAAMIREAAAQLAEFTLDGDFDVDVPLFIWGIFIGMALLWLLTLVAMWKFFSKAGEPGWAILVPIYNMIVMLRIAGKPAWWFLLFCIPLVQIVVAIDVDVCTARRFGKGVGFGLGLLFLPMLFYPILAFGAATYNPGT